MLSHNLQFKFSDYFNEVGQPARQPMPRIEGHAHTDFTDGQSTAEDCVQRALDIGLETLVFAEHSRRGAPWIDDYFQEVNRLKNNYQGKLHIICGVEARALDTGGTLDADADTLSRAELVIGSIHGIPRHGDTFESVYRVRGAREILEAEQAMLLGLIRNPAVDIIGHPFGTYHEKFGNPPESLLHEFLRAAADAGKAVEFNVRHSNIKWFLTAAASAGTDFLFWPASDAHIARHVGRCIETLNHSCGDEHL